MKDKIKYCKSCHIGLCKENTNFDSDKSCKDCYMDEEDDLYEDFDS